MGDDDISGKSRENLEKHLNDFQLSSNRLLELYNESMHFYTNTMQQRLAETKSYYDQNSLMEMHRKAKKDAISKVGLLNLRLN